MKTRLLLLYQRITAHKRIQYALSTHCQTLLFVITCGETGQVLADTIRTLKPTGLEEINAVTINQGTFIHLTVHCLCIHT